MINTGSHFWVLWKAGHKLSTAKQKIHKINFATQSFELINRNMKAKSSYTIPFVTITPPPLSRASKYGTSHWIILTWFGMTRNNLWLRTWGQFVIFDTSLKKNPKNLIWQAMLLHQCYSFPLSETLDLRWEPCSKDLSSNPLYKCNTNIEIWPNL